MTEHEDKIISAMKRAMRKAYLNPDIEADFAVFEAALMPALDPDKNPYGVTVDMDAIAEKAARQRQYDKAMHGELKSPMGMMRAGYDVQHEKIREAKRLEAGIDQPVEQVEKPLSPYELAKQGYALHDAEREENEA